jgi:competence protein ComEA
MAVVLGAAVAAFLAAWWLSPVAAESAGSLTTIGMTAATASPTGVPASQVASASGVASESGAGSASGPGSASGAAAVSGAASARGDSPGQEAAGTNGGTTSAGSPSGSTRSLFVHVSGAVVKPGLVEVADGARVFDAVAKAGGVTPEAREGGVNLARFVVDGEQILVPRADDPASAGTAATASAAGGGSSSGGAVPGPSGSAGKVNLNTATAAELETLPRVGPSMSAKILAWRAENGAFSAIEDLNDVDGVGDKTFESLKDLVTL